MTPEVTQGPFHILGEIVRQNITEGQAGVPLNISMDFVDLATCEPVQVWVDAWHANATGYYAGYIAETSIITGGSGGNMTISGMSSNTSTTGSVASSSTSLGAYSGADSGATQISSTTDDNSTFLRGVFRSDEDGHLKMYSIMPGWYFGRAQHIHIKVYPEGEIASNGTFIVGGSAVHTGQFFFDSDTLTAVAATEIYAANPIAWSDAVSNQDDQWYPYQSALEYNADLDITWVGNDIMDGLNGRITIGLNMSYTSPEIAAAYAGFDVAAYEVSSLLPYASESSVSPDGV
jgi:protocatechuate 3,4-dioxygenase beta subunit